MRHYAKLCELPDFEDPQLAALIGEIAPSYSASQPHRKAWEFAMGALFLSEVGRLNGDAEILDVAAGHEEIVFWLAQRARRVVATDIYGRGAFGDREAAASMLADPAAHAPYPYPNERLEVLDMDARQLAFEDESFDAVVSFSSIEHFGSPRGIAAGAREIGRVLRPADTPSSSPSCSWTSTRSTTRPSCSPSGWRPWGGAVAWRRRAGAPPRCSTCVSCATGC